MEAPKVVFKTGKEMYNTAKLTHTIRQNICQNIVTDVMTQLTKNPPHWNFENDSFILNESPIDCTQLLTLNEKERLSIDNEYLKYMNEMFKKYDLKLDEYYFNISQQGKQLSRMVSMKFTLVKD